MDVDPFALLGKEGDAWGGIDGADLYVLAVRQFDPSRSEPLAALLVANDLLVRRRGLVVFADLGRKARGLLDLALLSADHPDEMARAALMDGVICYPESLSPLQARTVLKLADDQNDLVRSGVVTFLRESSADVLRAAIEGMPPEVAREYSRGLERLEAPDRSAQALLEEGVSTTGVRSTFALAAVERMAKNGLIENAPLPIDGSWIGAATCAQIDRLIKRRERGGRG